MTVKEEALVIEKASEELEEIDEEVALILTDFQFPNQAKVEHRETPNLLNDVKEVMATKIHSKMAPTPEPVKMAPTPEPIKMAPTPEPVKIASTPVKMASEPVKMAPSPVKLTPSPEPVKMAPPPEPVKITPTPEPANPFITPKFNNTVKPPDIITSPPVAAPVPAPKPSSPPTIAQVQQKEPKTEIYYSPDCFHGVIKFNMHNGPSMMSQGKNLWKYQDPKGLYSF